MSSTSLTPGASSNALRARATSTGLSNKATMLSECARDVGIRTAVQLIYHVSNVPTNNSQLVIISKRDLCTEKNINLPDRKVIREATYLPRLPRHLHLLFSISVVLELVNVRYNVEW